jgi:AcrR family transcriptional regulator
MTDMTTQPSRQSSRFHAALKGATREAILHAVEHCLMDSGLDALTFAQVAQAAAISERTVYRHFATREALLEAFWERIQRTLGLQQSIESWDLHLASRPAAFAEMDRRDKVLRELMRSGQAHEARLRINARRQAGIRKVVAERVGALPEPAFTELCALVHLLGSAPAWAALKDYWGIEGEHAGRVVARAISALATAASTPEKPK